MRLVFSPAPRRVVEDGLRISQPFDAIEVGEIDDFAFNVTTCVGCAQILNTRFVCRLMPFSDGVDLNPASRLSNPGFSSTGICYRDANDVVQLRQGYFATVRVGPMPASAAGGTYMLGYQAFLDDGRIIQGSSTVQCMLQGGQ